MPAALEVEEITKRYGDRTALDAVSFTVEQGDCLALLGPNGAGKSTLIDILATVREPTRGDARIQGASITREPDVVRRRVGVAFQSPFTHDHLTAREVVLHHARLYAVDGAGAKADELLDFVDLSQRADERVQGFSDGMKRRVDLARVLVTDPEVLLLDEPAAGLDPRGRQAIRDRLTELTRQGTTLLVATHQMREAAALADRVAILDQGRVLALDEPKVLAGSLGDHVVLVELAGTQDASGIRDVLAGLEVTEVRETAGAVEVLLDGRGARPGEVVDALDEADIGYEEVTVRAPDLADVFLELTGRPLEERAEVRA